LTARDNHQTLRILKEQNIVVEGIVVQMDCNMREFFAELVAQSPDSDITIITDGCEDIDNSIVED
jgi:hypothetical protein